MKIQVNIIATSAEEKLKVVTETLRTNCSSNKTFRAINVKANGALREYRASMDTSTGFKGRNAVITDYSVETEVGAYAPVRHLNMETVVLLEFGDKVVTFSDVTTAQGIADDRARNALTSIGTMSSAVLPVINSLV
ncbi:hypothetical protein [Yersinia phage vB_YenM_P778]